MVKRFMKIHKKLINSCINGNSINLLKIPILENKKTSFKLIENVSKAYFILRLISRNIGNRVFSSKKSNKVTNISQSICLKKDSPMVNLLISKILLNLSLPTIMVNKIKLPEALSIWDKLNKGKDTVIESFLSILQRTIT